jgi:ThiF family
VTDDDTIEKSNLSRQFLFRDWDIGAFKATVAGKAALKINSTMRQRLLQNRVSTESEDVFNDEFWQVCAGPRVLWSGSTSLLLAASEHSLGICGIWLATSH